MYVRSFKGSIVNLKHFKEIFLRECLNDFKEEEDYYTFEIVVVSTHSDYDVLYEYYTKKEAEEKLDELFEMLKKEDK